MNLYEFQSKNLFLQFNLPVLKHWTYFDIPILEDCISDITDGPPWVVKCQIRSGGRGKSGGVSILSSRKEIIAFAKQWLGQSLVTYQTADSGEIVHALLIEPFVTILRELYISISIDRNSSQIVFMASSKGGMNIEHTISTSPDLLHKMIIDPINVNVQPYEGRVVAYKLGLVGKQIFQFSEIYTNMVRMFLQKDLTLIEINPLTITNNNDLICLDAKVIVDHNSLFRQPQLSNLYFKNNDTDNLSIAKYDSYDNHYISLNGNIGCMVNGAGLAMATMDLMKLLGGFPANFLDIGGDTNETFIISSLEKLIKNIKIKAILINIFGGIVCCDLVARSIINTISECDLHIPIVVRLEGNNAKLGSDKLMNYNNPNIIVINDLMNAIQKVIKLVNNNVNFN